MWREKSSRTDYFNIFFLSVAIVITFSGQAIDAKWFNNRFCYWLGKFSLYIYLSHSAWCKQIAVLMPEGTSVKKLVIVYVAASGLTAVALYFVSMLWRKVSPALGKRSRKLLTKA